MQDDRFVFTNGVLDIFKLKKSDSDVYECQAKNIANQQVTKQFRLTVKGELNRFQFQLRSSRLLINKKLKLL